MSRLSCIQRILYATGFLACLRQDAKNGDEDGNDSKSDADSPLHPSKLGVQRLDFSPHLGANGIKLALEAGDQIRCGHGSNALDNEVDFLSFKPRLLEHIKQFRTLLGVLRRLIFRVRLDRRSPDVFQIIRLPSYSLQGAFVQMCICPCPM